MFDCVEEPACNLRISDVEDVYPDEEEQRLCALERLRDRVPGYIAGSWYLGGADAEHYEVYYLYGDDTMLHQHRYGDELDPPELCPMMSPQDYQLCIDSKSGPFGNYGCSRAQWWDGACVPYLEPFECPK